MARPSKYDPKFNKQVFKLALLGAKDTEIADFLEITEQTLNNWKKEYPELFESLKKGRKDADAKVVKSLYKRALGFKFKEYTHEKIELKEWSGVTGNFEITPATRIKCVEKLIVPDTTAQIFWLKNRQPKNWRDKQEIEHSGEALKAYEIVPASSKKTDIGQ
jgi:hypothetical protein